MAELLLALRALLALLLYAFLGVGFYVLWRGLRRGEASPISAPPAARLNVETGPDAGKQVTVHTVTAIGRADDNDLTLQDPFASAYHALIFWREQQWWLEDLESHNGTLLNSEWLTQPTPLVYGDQMRIGESIVRFEAGTPPPENSES